MTKISDRPFEESTDELEELRVLMLATVRRRCPAHVAAEDIVQRAMLNVLQGRATLPPGEKVGQGYWRRAAHNALIDELRLHYRKYEEQAPEDNEHYWPSPTPDAEDVMSNRQLGQNISSCLRVLARSRKRVVALAIFGHSVRETVTLLAIPDKKVRNLRFRGLQDLRACLAEKGVTSWT